jgi:hypothetical protein
VNGWPDAIAFAAFMVSVFGYLSAVAWSKRPNCRCNQPEHLPTTED